MYTDFWTWLSLKTKLFLQTAKLLHTQSEELFIWAFFSNFAWMLQFAIVAQLSLVADFLDFKNDQSFILNDDNDET